MATALCSSKKESQEGDRDAAVKAILLQSELHTLPEGKDPLSVFGPFKDMNERAFSNKRMRIEVLQKLHNDNRLAPFILHKFPRVDAEVIALIPLLKTTSLFLSIGGDDRLTIDNKSRMNKYLSSTEPRIFPSVRRGSCTCSTITEEDYIHAESSRKVLLDSLLSQELITDDLVHSTFDGAMQSIIERLKAVLNIQQHQLVTFPSGSDAEFLPLAVALLRSHTLTIKATGANHAKVFNFVLAAGEVGSGTPNASWGRHFSPFAPRGDLQKVGDVLDGLPADSVELIQLKPRDSDGEVAFDEEALIYRVQQTLSQSEGREGGPVGVAVVHLVCGSKTGLVYPSLSTIEKLRAQWGERVLVVADCCQLRCRLEAVKTLYLDAGMLCLVTGSKFFAAPPFCGAVLLPAAVAKEMEDYLESRFFSSDKSFCAVPAGLSRYITRFDVPTAMPRLRGFLQLRGRFAGAEGDAFEEWVNVGLYLRWQVGIRSMERYHQLPPSLVESFTRYWVSHLRDTIRRYASPWIQLLPEDDEAAGRAKGQEQEMTGGVCSIVSFTVFVPDRQVDPTSGGSVPRLRRLTFDEMKELHRVLAVPSGPDESGDQRAVMLGQPVKLSDKNGLTVLRIALGADMVIDALSASNEGVFNMEKVQKIEQDDLFVVSKIAKLAQSWASEQPAADPAASSLLSKMHRIDRELVARVTGGGEASSLTLQTVSSLLKEVFGARAEDRSIFANDAVPVGLPETMVLYDLDSFGSSISSLQTAFSSGPFQATEFLHCFAVKSCPLPYILHRALKAGLGLEAASLNEVKQGLRLGCPAHKIMFDSPCKSSSEIEFALLAGVHVNANTLSEVDKIAAALDRLRRSGRLSALGPVGVRINPLVGAGEIAALSTATKTSKFGVPVSFSDPESVEKIVQLFVTHPFLTSLMCHVGSQGMSLSAMSQGAQSVFRLADLIDSRCGTRRVSTVDIGGGLSANYQSDQVTPTFSQYASALYEACGQSATSGRVIITEFGKALVTKSGAIATLVEDVLHSSQPRPDGSGPHTTATAICHAGADLLLRTAYCPDKFPHRVALLDGRSLAPKLRAQATESVSQVSFVGPLCFSGDIISSNAKWEADAEGGGAVPMSAPVVGDVCVILDAGANTLSLFSRHCSRSSPAVYAFRRAVAVVNGLNQSRFLISRVREAETDQQVLDFWG